MYLASRNPERQEAKHCHLSSQSSYIYLFISFLDTKIKIYVIQKIETHVSLFVDIGTEIVVTTGVDMTSVRVVNPLPLGTVMVCVVMTVILNKGPFITINSLTE